MYQEAERRRQCSQNRVPHSTNAINQTYNKLQLIGLGEDMQARMSSKDYEEGKQPMAAILRKKQELEEELDVILNTISMMDKVEAENLSETDSPSVSSYVTAGDPETDWMMLDHNRLYFTGADDNPMVRGTSSVDEQSGSGETWPSNTTIEWEWPNCPPVRSEEKAASSDELTPSSGAVGKEVSYAEKPKTARRTSQETDTTSYSYSYSSSSSHDDSRRSKLGSHKSNRCLHLRRIPSDVEPNNHVLEKEHKKRKNVGGRSYISLGSGEQDTMASIAENKVTLDSKMPTKNDPNPLKSIEWASPKRLTRAPVPPGASDCDDIIISHETLQDENLTMDNIISTTDSSVEVNLLESDSLWENTGSSKRASSTRETLNSSSSWSPLIYSRVDSGDVKVSRRVPARQNARSHASAPPRDVEVDPFLVKSRIESNEGIPGGDLEKGQRREEDITRHIKEDRRCVKVDRRSLCLVLVAIFLLLGGAAAIIVYYLEFWDNGIEINSNAATKIDAPTMAPTSFTYDVMPVYTQEALQDPFSPQSRAYEWLIQDGNENFPAVGLASQRFVLATLFYATKGEYWDSMGAWLAYNRPECNWFKHEFHSLCDSAGRFHTLSLPGNNLKGTLPEELALLPASIVQLQNNGLNGTLPSGIWSSWNHLVFLNIYNNSIEGTIPPEIAYLAPSRHFNTLNLRSNNFSGSLPTELGLLKLQFMSLSGNQFWGPLPSELGLMSNARELYLYKNRFFGTIPSTLGQLTKLRRLELHGNDFIGSVPQEVCDLFAIGNLKTLTVDCDWVTCTCGCDCSASMDRLTGDAVFDTADGSQ